MIVFKRDNDSYNKYGGEPTEEPHKLILIPQTVIDAWQAACACGKWEAIESFYAVETKNELLHLLEDAYKDHIEESVRLHNKDFIGNAN